MIKLVIFDVDGVIIDSESLYIDLAMRISKSRGYNIPLEAIMATLGTNVKTNKDVILSFMGQDFDYEKYDNELRIRWAEEKIDNPPDLKPGFIELISYLKQNNIKTAFATSTEKERQYWNLNRLDVLKYFDYTVYGDEVKNSKPDPEIYLSVIKHFKYDLGEIIIIEDSANGLLSALASGCKVIYCPDLAIVPKEIQDRVFKKVNCLTDCIDVINETN